MVVPSTSSPQTHNREPAEKEGLEQQKKRLLFDWSDERRGKVVIDSGNRLERLLTEKLGETVDAETSDAKNISKLWKDIVTCFTQNEPNHSNLLVINGQQVDSFEPSKLPTHSEYHIAKVITLTTELYKDYLPKEQQTEENAIALSLSAVVHDIGSLQKAGEKGPQERFYKFHELRAISLVDNIVDKLTLKGYTNEADKQRLKNKIKILIAATIPAFNLGNNPIIKKLIKPEGNPITEQDFLTKLNLDPAIMEDIETEAMKTNLLPHAQQLYQLFQSLETSESPLVQDEMIELSKVMAAADHGAYMFEPARIPEIVGLWQELSTHWKDVDGKLIHRPFTKDFDNSFLWLTSPFPQLQWNTHREVLKKLVINPFIEGNYQSIEDAESFTYELRDKLLQPIAKDSLLRFEGFFSPVLLVELANSDGVNLGNNDDIKTEIVSFSQDFAQRFSEPHDFDKLATKVLVKMYQLSPNKTTFLRTALSLIGKETSKEMKDGIFTLHIAPNAYETDSEQFLNYLSEAYKYLDEETKKRIDRIHLTVRENRGDRFEAITNAIRNHRQKTPHDQVSPMYGISLGGMPSDHIHIPELIANVAQDKSEIETLIHFGLETNYEALEKRLSDLLSSIRTHENIETVRKLISIHIDDDFEFFTRYYKSDKHTEDRELLASIVKSISPLGYMLTKGDTAFNAMEEFYATFKDTKIGSNDPALLGALGVAGQRLFEQFLLN